MIKSYLVLLFVACFLFSMNGEAKTKQTTRKVVRVDFDQPAPQTKAKQKKEIKPVAKAEAPKKTFKSISCHNGFIVGQKAYCSVENKSPVKKGRSVTSVNKAASKKLK